MKLPARYEVGFLRDFDKRTEVYQLLSGAYKEIIDDLGGIEGLSHIRLALVERFVFLEFSMRNLEKRMAENPLKTGRLLSRWVQAINSLSGLAKSLGMERKSKHAYNLKTYIDKRKQA